MPNTVLNSPVDVQWGQSKPVAKWGLQHTGLCSPLWFPAPAQVLWLLYASHVAVSDPAIKWQTGVVAQLLKHLHSVILKDFALNLTHIITNALYWDNPFFPLNETAEFSIL